ncbi:hypothetical protein J1N35_010254 [Gossypium stocksii]|uniref:Reverse transcriptase domain-containing protein n=1 Tax=Gossypium stocksii TaxID=47602 RepID=A0A9D4ACK2_9ROSI|nr:hypothetical protein J1N35_010254 [Gossypium stocksii]
MEEFQKALEAHEIIKEVLQKQSGNILENFEHTQLSLQKWAKKIKGDCKRKSKFLRERLAELDKKNRNDDILAEIIDVKIELNWEMEKEEMYWDQKARSNWLSQGDRNTAFFHSQASQKRRINRIRGMEDNERILKTEEEDIEIIIRNYFMKLFESKGVGNTNHLLSGVRYTITDNMNQLLATDYKEEEILAAINSIRLTKASGPDGFLTIFFQKFWHIIGREVNDFCLEVLNKGKSFDLLNHTNIVLIPKNSHPKSPSEFRPISLCSVFYKIISKSIANKLQKVLEYCIDLAQSTFVLSRLITDNVLLAYEILQSMKNKKMGKKGLMALKIDMNKAYDRVEWNFLKQIMAKMGFDESWIQLIMKCIRTISYSVVLNGKLGEVFIPKRGLR